MGQLVLHEGGPLGMRNLVFLMHFGPVLTHFDPLPCTHMAHDT